MSVHSHRSRRWLDEHWIHQKQESLTRLELAWSSDHHRVRVEFLGREYWGVPSRRNGHSISDASLLEHQRKLYSLRCDEVPAHSAYSWCSCRRVTYVHVRNLYTEIRPLLLDRTRRQSEESKDRHDAATRPDMNPAVLPTPRVLTAEKIVR